MMSVQIEKFISSLSGRTDIEALATDVTLGIICETMFGQVPQDTRQLAKAVKILNDVAMKELQNPVKLPDWFPSKFKKQKRWAIDYLDGTIWKFIRERRNSKKDQGDLLSSLLQAVDVEGDKKGMSEKQVRDECIGLFLAGHDTSAAGLIWAFYNLSKFENHQNSLRNEVKAAWGDGPLSFSKVKSLRLVENFINESLRLYPPAIGVFQRQAIEDVRVGGFDIPKGTLIQPISYVVHRDPRWFSEPDEFRPERFNVVVNQNAFFPFGTGPRVCIGRSFAMLELVLTVAMTLLRFKVELCEPEKTVVLNSAFSLRPKEKLFLKFTPL